MLTEFIGNVWVVKPTTEQTTQELLKTFREQYPSVHFVVGVRNTDDETVLYSTIRHSRNIKLLEKHGIEVLGH